jgi:hypothetical protein
LIPIPNLGIGINKDWLCQSQQTAAGGLKIRAIAARIGGLGVYPQQAGKMAFWPSFHCLPRRYSGFHSIAMTGNTWYNDGANKLRQKGYERMAQFTYTNSSDHDKFVVYSRPMGMSLDIATVRPGDTWHEGAMESFYKDFDDYDEAWDYMDRIMNPGKYTDTEK